MIVVNDGDLKKIKSGIESIDGQLGGLIEGKAYLVYGEPGTGKTLSGLQFLNQGLIQGETCGLISQENPEDVLTTVRHIGFDWDVHLGSGRLMILRYQSNFALRFSKSFNLDEIFDELQHLCDNTKINRLVFDPITPFVDCVNRINHTKVFTEFFAHLERLGPTTVLTLDELSGIDSSSFLRTLISLSFGVIHLRISSDLKRKMFFQKMRYQSALLQPAVYVIEPGKGIVFLASEKRNPGTSKTAKKKILVADADEEMCDGIKRILGEKFALTVVHDGVEAVRKIVNGSLDLIILDATLPNIDGFDICRIIRSHRSHVPVFFISGRMRRISDKIKAFNLGADEYMLKPVNLLELESRVGAILQRGRDLKHTVLPSAGVFNEEISTSSGSLEKGARVLLSDVDFKKRVEREIERGPSDFFTLVSCQFKGMNGQQWEDCTRILVSAVREYDFVGNLGNGKACIFLRGANVESSAFFIKRAKKRILEAIRKELDSSCPSIKMKSGSAAFPIDGADTTTLVEKAFGDRPRKS